MHCAVFIDYKERFHFWLIVLQIGVSKHFCLADYKDNFQCSVQSESKEIVRGIFCKVGDLQGGREGCCYHIQTSCFMSSASTYGLRVVFLMQHNRKHGVEVGMVNSWQVNTVCIPSQTCNQCSVFLSFVKLPNHKYTLT